MASSIQSAFELDRLGVSREKFLDPTLKDQVAQKVQAGEALLFLGNDVVETRKKEAYQLFIHGILPCGSKTTLTICGIDPYVDVRLLQNETDAEAKQRMQGLANATGQDDTLITNIEFKSGKEFLYYSHLTSRYARVFFRTLKSRDDFMKLCSNYETIKTFSNDKSSYYRVVARNYEINLSGWNVLHKYETNHATKSKAAYSFLVNADDIELVDDDKKLAALANSHGYDPSIVKYENMIIASFDIEMIPERLGQFPDADKNARDTIFMICITYHFVKRPDAILSVCLTLKETDPLDEMLIVHCATERCLVEAFARFMSFMQPDFITEFNGGGFDWRNIITKVCLTGAVSAFLSDMSIVKLERWELQPALLGRFHTERNIKINGATPDAICKGFKAPGFVGFDTMIVFKQLEPNADSHKLNECLRRCNLGSKDDLDVKEMFQIYLSGSSEEMKMVAHYCYIDTVVLQKLLLKKNVIQDRREVANLSYTSMFDNFYFAGGSRMRNLLMNRGSKLGYFFDTQYRPQIENPDAKFPGAYVVPPIKGIVKPLLRLDEFAKQNDNHLSSDELKEGYQFIADHFEQMFHSSNGIDTESAPEYLRSYVEYTNSNQTHYPIAGLDFASLYPSIIMTYNVSPEKLIIDEAYANEVAAMGKSLQFVTFPFCGKMVKAWFVRHNNVAEEYSICSKLLIELFDRRAAIKKVLKHHGDAIFEMEQEMKPFLARGAQHEYPRLQEYNDAKFDYVSYDSKQRAVKIFMNTLYGEMGNFVSCICAVQVAASVTTMGRYNLRIARRFVEDQLHMKVYYGDSVVGDTPIMIERSHNGIRTRELIPIEDLAQIGKVCRYYFDPYRSGKECVTFLSRNIKVMTETGYSPILKVIRHYTTKKLYRITTRFGSVIVTEDHSLLDSDKAVIKPHKCRVGTSLLHWSASLRDAAKPVELSTEQLVQQLCNEPDKEDEADEEAFVKGVFFSCGEYVDPFSFRLKHNNQALLQKCVCIFNNRYDGARLNFTKTYGGFTVSSAAVDNAGHLLVAAWRKAFYSSRMQKKVPQDILEGDQQAKLSFLRGYSTAAGKSCFTRIKSSVGAQGIFLLLTDLGYNAQISGESRNSICLTVQSLPNHQNQDEITSIELLGEYHRYVYDLETETHHFAAGVGRLVVHNTDSLYVSCDKSCFADYDREYFCGRVDKLSYGTNLVEETFRQIAEAKQQVNEHLIADNGTKHLQMAYEEVLYPVAFLSKKKYYGVPHEANVDFYPRKLFLRGLEVVKRGSSAVLKDVVNAVLLEAMDLNTTHDIIDIIKRAVERFFTTKWPIDAFAKAKVFRPDKNNIAVSTMICRYREMQYPTIPEPNVRFQTVVCKYYPWTYDIKGRIQSKMGIGDRLELVERVQQENLEIDLEYYFDNELTGQFARLITFCKEFANCVPALESIDTSAMSEIEIDQLNKEQYQKTEDALFKAAKKFVGQLAKHYSKAFKNKFYLYTNTWQEISKFIDSRMDLHPFTREQRIVMHLIATGFGEDIRTKLVKGIGEFVNITYRPALSDDQIKKLCDELERSVSYIYKHNLNKALVHSIQKWKENICMYVREEYNYGYICQHDDLKFKSLWEVMTRQELEVIARDPSLFPQFTNEQATIIVDWVVAALCRVLTVEQMLSV